MLNDNGYVLAGNRKRGLATHILEISHASVLDALVLLLFSYATFSRSMSKSTDLAFFNQFHHRRRDHESK